MREIRVRDFAFGPDGNLYATSIWTDQVLEYDGKTGAYLGVTVPAGANPSGTNANATVSIGDASAIEGNTTFRYFDDLVPMQARLTGVLDRPHAEHCCTA